MENVFLTNMTQLLTLTNWQDYELIDSGDGEKLERFGTVVTARPEPKSLWHKTSTPAVWAGAHALYHRDHSGGGQWQRKNAIPANWSIGWGQARFILRPTGFKHVGIFPETAILWEWITQQITQAHRPSINVLNLFGYTGGATIAAAFAGAKVTHVDSSKEILSWANENRIASKIADTRVRWIPDDAIAFLKREVKRQNHYDAVILDPPKFGRGIKGEVFKIEEQLATLLDLCTQVLSPNPLFLLMTVYTVEYSAVIFENLLKQKLQNKKNIPIGKTDAGEIALVQTSNGFIVPQSVFASWSRT